MKRLLQFGFVLILIATPCCGGGKDDFTTAEDLLKKCEYENSANLFGKAILSGELSDDELVAAHYYRAVSFFILGPLEEAFKEINQVLKLRPDHVGAYALRANSWVALGKIKGEDTDDRALADWAKVLELNPNDAIAYNDRSMFYAEKGQLDKAIEDMETCVKLEPNTPYSLKCLERLKARRVEQESNKKETH